MACRALRLHRNNFRNEKLRKHNNTPSKGEEGGGEQYGMCWEKWSQNSLLFFETKESAQVPRYIIYK